MRHFFGFSGARFAAALLLLNLSTAIAALAASADARIAQAVTPRQVLRQGTSTLECQPENPKDGFTRCYSNLVAPRYDFQAKLRAEKKSDKEIEAATAAAIKSGALKVPPMGTMSYRLSSKDGVIKRLWIVSVPYATPEMLGVSTVSQRDAALKGQGLPWMMLPGTAGAHIMIPIN
jgi:hypothetical protein